jgi:phosphoribosylglycinamide formyltransferase-1
MRVGVLVSGYGSNLEALLSSVHGREVRIVCVGSDRGDARALTVASDAGIPTQAFPKADHPDRTARDLALADWLDEHGVQLVITAGYMALLSPEFIARFPDRIINVHPSLLPAFPRDRAGAGSRGGRNRRDRAPRRRGR